MTVYQEQHGRGSAIWSSAFSAAMGDGIVPRTAPRLPVKRTQVAWPWSRSKPSTTSR